MTRWLSPWWLLVVFVVVQVPLALRPIGGQHHKWRQADTAAVARNLAFESPDPLHPRIDLRGDLSGITGMEFPLYQSIVAIPLVLTRSDSDAWGRLVSLLAAALAWMVLARWLVLRVGLDAWSVHVACASVPILGGYANLFMPETTALLLALLCADRLETWWQGGSRRDLLLGTVALAAAGLTRPYMMFYGLFILVGASLALRADRRKALALFIAGACALVPFAAWYGVWSPHLVTQYGLDYFFRGTPLAENLRVLSKPATWKSLAEVLTAFYVKKSILVVALVGIGAAPALVRAARTPWFAWVMLAGIPAVTVPLLLVVTADHFQPHVYYFFGIVPSSVMLLALGLHAIRRAVPAAFPLVGAFCIAAALKTYTSHFSPRDDEWPMVADVLPAVQASVPEDALVVVEDLGSLPWHLHAVRRRGWVEKRSVLDDGVQMRALAQRGARWVLWVDRPAGKYALSSMADWLGRVEAP